MFNSGKWNESYRSAFLTVKYLKTQNLIFQDFPIKRKDNKFCKNNRLEETNGSGKVVVIVASKFVEIVRIVKCGGNFLELYDGSFVI